MERFKAYSEVFDQHRGNFADKWESYLRVYDHELSPLRDSVRKMLEIGVQNGGSLEVFAGYFADAEQIVGLDICEDCRNISFADPRISVEIADASSGFANQLLRQTYGQFDLILDDGSHRCDDITATFFSLVPLLAPGGTYIIEDMCCVYWREFGGGLKSPASPMRLFKQLVDVINHEHWRSGFGIAAYLRELGYDSLGEDVIDRLRQIRSISFYNSICVIRFNQNEADNLIGPRFCRGEHYALGFHATPGQTITEVGEPQHDNPFNQSGPV